MIEKTLSCLGAPDRESQMAAEFALIWDIYPKRVNEREAIGCYRARRKEGVNFRTLYTATVAYKDDRKGQEKRYTMHADVFFGANHRYKDFDGKTNGQTERKDGMWAPPMQDLQALAKRQEKEKEDRKEESPTRSVKDRMADL